MAQGTQAIAKASAKTKKRIGYIDIAKAIAIGAIIAGHLAIVYNSSVFPGGCPEIVKKFCFTFHLPVFFICSGFFMKFEQGLDLDYVKKSAKGLLLPYAVACVLIVIACTVNGFFSPTMSASAEFIRWGQASIWGAGAVMPNALWGVERIGGLWFLLAMFWARLIIAATNKMPDWARLALFAGLSVAATVSASYVWLPWSIQSGAGCAFWLFFGMLARKHGLFEDGKVPPIIWVEMLVLWGYCIIYGGNMGIAICCYPLGVIDVFGGISACFCIVWISKKIEKVLAPAIDNAGTASSAIKGKCLGAIEAIGRNTLAIFAMHILEDNLFNWGLQGMWLSNALDGSPFCWVILLLVRFAVDGLLVTIMWVFPPTRWVFFPGSKKRKEPKETTA